MSRQLALSVQYAVDMPELPDEQQLARWSEAALASRLAPHALPAELTIRIVDAAESSVLNQTYRHKHGATNVLAFPFEPPPGLPAPSSEEPKPLGDVIVCAPVVASEAVTQGKALTAHWAHLVVHGVLHLLGYDHQQQTQAEAMEALEAQVLAELGYPDPYLTCAPVS